MGSGDEEDVEPADGETTELTDDESTDSGPIDDEPDDAAPEAAGEPLPVLEQRFSLLMVVRSTLHPQGLVVEVSRPFSQRVSAVDFDRLVLDPAAVSTLRRDGMWAAAACFAGALLLTLPPAAGVVPMWAAPTLLGLAALCAMAVAIAPRHVTMFLDREQDLHPIFLRHGADEPAVAAFVEEMRRAAIAWRCRPPVAEDEDAGPRRPRLADTLDALLAMRQEDLITDTELLRFREMANRR